MNGPMAVDAGQIYRPPPLSKERVFGFRRLHPATVDLAVLAVDHPVSETPFNVDAELLAQTIESLVDCANTCSQVPTRACPRTT